MSVIERRSSFYKLHFQSFLTLKVSCLPLLLRYFFDYHCVPTDAFSGRRKGHDSEDRLCNCQLHCAEYDPLSGARAMGEPI